MATSLQTTLETLIGREPTTEELAKFYKIREACGFSDHDAVWSLLAAFGHYEILYGSIPSKIVEETVKLLAEHKLAIEATAQAAERGIKTSLYETVREATSKLVDEARATGDVLSTIRAKRSLVIGSLLSAGLAAIMLVVVGWSGYLVGARSSSVHAAWLQSSEGVAARQLAQVNSIRTMLDCPAPYQTHREGGATYCIPYDPVSKKSWGWRIN